MDADGTGKTPVYLENGGRSGEKVQKDLDHTNGVSHSVELEKRPPYEQFNPESSSSTQNERKNLLEVGHSSASWKFNTGLSDEFVRHGSSLSSGVEKMTSNEQYEACTTPKRTYMVHHSSAIEISHSRGSSMSPLPWAKRGLDHCVTSPLGSHRNLFLEGHEVSFSRSLTEKTGSPIYDLKLDKLSKREKEKLIMDLVKIQGDGTVEVDISKSTPLASELLELHSVEGPPPTIDQIIDDYNKSIPKLKIAVLVVGTRGDVQPFLAMAKRLQEFGHQVRLATHSNFRDFVKSAGIDFFPLGGDPRILAGCKRYGSE